MTLPTQALVLSLATYLGAPIGRSEKPVSPSHGKKYQAFQLSRTTLQRLDMFWDLPDPLSFRWNVVKLHPHSKHRKLRRCIAHGARQEVWSLARSVVQIHAAIYYQLQPCYDLVFIAASAARHDRLSTCRVQALLHRQPRNYDQILTAVRRRSISW
jgi:hypothetical protein